MYVSVHVFFPGKYHTEAEVNISTSLDSFSLKAKNINFLLRVAHIIDINATENKIHYPWIYSTTNVSSWKIHSLEMISTRNDLAGRFNNHHHRFYLKIPFSRNVFPTSCWSRSSSLFWRCVSLSWSTVLEELGRAGSWWVNKSKTGKEFYQIYFPNTR